MKSFLENRFKMSIFINKELLLASFLTCRMKEDDVRHKINWFHFTACYSSPHQQY